MMEYLINNSGGIIFAILGMATAREVWTGVNLTVATWYTRFIWLRYRVLDFH